MQHNVMVVWPIRKFDVGSSSLKSIFVQDDKSTYMLMKYSNYVASKVLTSV